MPCQAFQFKWNYLLVNCHPMMVVRFGRWAGFLGSPICLAIMAPKLCEAWGTKYLGFPNFEATRISKAIKKREFCTITPHANVGMEATVTVGNSLWINLSTQFNVSAFPLQRNNPTYLYSHRLFKNSDFWQSPNPRG